MTAADTASGIRISHLDNGIAVASDPMAGVGSVTVGLWLSVGARHEEAEENGIAHLIEHMAFKGTQTRNARQIAEEIEAVGGQLNAYTSRESTAFYSRVLGEDLPLAVDILSDILRHSLFDGEELAREKAVVLQEIGMAEDTPDDIVFDRLQETAFPDQALGRPILGRARTVAGLGRNDLERFVGAHYGADRILLAASGAVEHQALVALAEERLSAVGKPAQPSGQAAAYSGGEIRIERPLEQVNLALGLPGVPLRDPDYVAAGLLASILGGGMSSRLFQEIREKRGLVYSVYSFFSHFEDSGLLTLYAGTGEETAAQTLALMIDELRGLADGVGVGELDRAKAQAKAAVLMSRESSVSRAEAMANHYLVHRKALDLPAFLAKLEAVEPEDIARLTARLLRQRPALAVMGPPVRLPSYDQLAGRLK
ncbi:MAG: insulinase family protein [Rhodospirillales bacterium]|nr:insulinase family protein [Rhodospirillales bacterium]